MPNRGGAAAARYLSQGTGGRSVAGDSRNHWLATNGPDAAPLRAAANRIIAGEPPKRGGIVEPPRRSPMVGTDLDVKRRVETGRNVDR